MMEVPEASEVGGPAFSQRLCLCNCSLDDITTFRTSAGSIPCDVDYTLWYYSRMYCRINIFNFYWH